MGAQASAGGGGEAQASAGGHRPRLGAGTDLVWGAQTSAGGGNVRPPPLLVGRALCFGVFNGEHT